MTNEMHSFIDIVGRTVTQAIVLGLALLFCFLFLRWMASRERARQHALLRALQQGDTYGLVLIGRVHDQTNGAVKLNLGSLFPTLHWMESKGLIRGYWGETSESRRGFRRRYYTLTGLGQRVIEQASATS